MTNWKALSTYIPYVSGLIILLGLLRQIIYYHAYNIDIQNYIGVSELLLAWVDESYFFIVYTGLTIFILRSNIITLEIKNIRHRAIVMGWTMSISFIIVIGLFFIKNYFLYTTLLVFLFFPISIFPAYHLFNSLCEDAIDPNLHIKPKSFKIIYAIIFAGITITFLTKGSIQLTGNGNFIGTTIVTKDSTYVSDSTNFYIGKTTNYFFIFNRKDHSSSIIPNNEVTLFKLKIRSPHFGDKVRKSK